MRRLIATLALMALAIPVSALEGCSTGIVEWDGTTPFIVRDDPTANPPPSAIGQFLWVTPSEPATMAFNGQIVAQAPANETTSVGVPSDAETFAVCYGTAEAPAAAGQTTPAIGEEVEREPADWQQNVDADTETFLRLIPFGVYLK